MKISIYSDKFLALMYLCERYEIDTKIDYEKRYKKLKILHPNSYIPADIRAFKNKCYSHNALFQKKLKDYEGIDPLSYRRRHVKKDHVIYEYPNGRRVKYFFRDSFRYRAHITEVSVLCKELEITSSIRFKEMLLDLEYLLDKYIPYKFSDVLSYRTEKEDAENRIVLNYEEFKELMNKEDINSLKEYRRNISRLKDKYPYRFYFHWRKTISDLNESIHSSYDLFGSVSPIKKG